MYQVHAGDVVSIHYTGRLEDGSVFDSSEAEEPLEFVAGGPEVIAGVSHAVVGMAEGEKKQITVRPEQGFGERRKELERKVPRSTLPPDAKLYDSLSTTSEGEQIVLWVRELTDEHAVIDANHPLAGQTLSFEIEIAAIKPKEA